MSRFSAPLPAAAALFSALAILGSPVAAQGPSVAVDIAPVHSLVARVMDGIGTPSLILPPGASPHAHSLRPSEARALQNADIVVWVGEDLTPWMQDAVSTLAADAAVLPLLKTDATMVLPFREGALFDAHDHGSDDHAYDDHGHDEHAHDDHAHDDHGHDEHAHDDHAHDDHGHDEHAHDDHAHGAHDPHVWLSPRNATAWLDLIAAQLSAADPDNADAYLANAAAGRIEMNTLVEDVTQMLAPVRAGRFIVFHDAYQYFETDFGFPASGAISLSDATDPSPARIAEVQERVRAQGIDCVLAEPQFNPGIVATVLDGTQARTAVIDPIGVDLALGAALYPQLIRNMATSLADCLQPG